jgi:hypothetical protein
MEPEDPGPIAIVDGVVQLSANGGHGKCIVVVAYVLTELFADMILAIEELE